MTAWATIANSEIQVDSIVDAVTEQKFRDRESYLKEVMAGSHTDKIPGQALETATAGSGLGLLVNHFAHWKATGTWTFTYTGETKEVDTTLAFGAGRLAFASLYISTPGGTGDRQYDWRVIVKPSVSATNFVLRMYRSGTGTGSDTVTWRVVAVQIS